MLFLRLLMHTVRNWTSFTFLKVDYSIPHISHSLQNISFTWLCSTLERNLRGSQRKQQLQWHDHFLVAVLVFCRLWIQKYQYKFSEDLLRNLRSNPEDTVETDEHVINGCLSSVQNVITSIGCNLLQKYGLSTTK